MLANEEKETPSNLLGVTLRKQCCALQNKISSLKCPVDFMLKIGPSVASHLKQLPLPTTEE